MRLSLILLAALAAAPAWAVSEPSAPLPRFASLKSEEVNVRAGPGTRYPIQWVYKRDGMPVEITAEFDQWRKIRDIEGASGWVHRMMLGGRRTAVIRGREAVTFRASPSEEARKVFKAQPMVVGALRKCGEAWCQLEVEGRRGWVKKNALWGVKNDEKFD